MMTIAVAVLAAAGKLVRGCSRQLLRRERRRHLPEGPRETGQCVSEIALDECRGVRDRAKGDKFAAVVPHQPLFGVVASDIGRPLADLANRFIGIDLVAEARTVLVQLTPLRREVKSESGTWYLCRITPYRTADNRIEGVVINLGDISDLKSSEEQTRAARSYAEAIVNTIHEPLVVLASYCQQVLGSDYLLGELVRDADIEWGRLMGERPYLERAGAAPDPDDPYTAQRVRETLNELVEQLAAEGYLTLSTGRRPVVAEGLVLDRRKVSSRAGASEGAADGNSSRTG